MLLSAWNEILTSDAIKYYHQCIMRTTVDIDDPVLKDLKKLQKREANPSGG